MADRGFNAAGSQRTSRCSTVGRLHDWHQAKRCAVGSSLPNPKRCAVGKSEAMRCRLAKKQKRDESLFVNLAVKANFASAYC